MNAPATAGQATPPPPAARSGAWPGSWSGPWRWIVSAALLAVAGASGWVLYTLDFDTAVSVRNTTRIPDAYMERFVTVEMNDAGLPGRRLEADYVAYHDDETIELSSPHYVLYRNEGEPWHVRSERGTVSADGTLVQLLGKVDIWRDDGSGARDIHIRTEHLTVMPESEYAETSEPVTIRTGATTSTGVGMRTWLDEARIELLSRVTTRVDADHVAQ